MSHSSQESKLSQYRETLLQLNTQFFLILSERRQVSLKIQELKTSTGRYSHFDPEREKALFELLAPDLKKLSLKELLSFSLIMEDQAMAMAPGSYPSWSNKLHLSSAGEELFYMINPLMLKFSRPELFERLVLKADFSFLEDF